MGGPPSLALEGSTMSRIVRHPSYQLCRALAGAQPGGSALDLCDVIAQALECAESPEDDQPPNPPTLAEAQRAIIRIRTVLDRAEKRLGELAR